MKNLLLLLLLLSNVVLAQSGRNSIWYFGNYAGIDFNSGTAVALTNSSMSATEGCATLCDEYGNLVMYTNGETVWNKNHAVMVNGTGLNGSYSASQSGMILPSPAQNYQVYIFTIDYEGNNDGLQYSIVDMSLQSGIGEVITKNVPLISPTTEMITATRHVNGIDIWVVAHKWNSNQYYSYLITSTGVQAPVITTIGDICTGPNGHAVGQMKFDTKGYKLGVIIRNSHHIQVLDFNPQTGVLSNVKTISGIVQNEYGLEFDVTGRYLYFSRYNGLTNGSEVYQYDILDSNITSTEVLVGTTNDTHVGSLQMAPNGKIYLARKSQHYLGVINSPSVQGVYCNFIGNGFYLGGKLSMYGLPSQILIDINNHTMAETTICEGDSVFLQNEFQSVGGIYMDTLLNALGGDSVIETELLIKSINLSLGNDTTICDDESIILDPGSFESYLWNTGDTIQMLNISFAGLYSVYVTDTIGCSASDSINVFVDDCIGLEKISAKKYRIFPNPTTGIVYIEVDGLIKAELINGLGKIVLSTNRNEMNLSYLPKGLYFVRVFIKDGYGVASIILE